ncbi:hypothetical protein ACJ5N2_17005 [Aeromonas salmonicida]|uniref:hypothetical protein n=1 Tax=Aeromonas salmonicida TaxID=645 RepID=UPI0038B7F3D4
MIQMKKIIVLMCIPLMLSGVAHTDQPDEPQQRMIMVNPGHLTPYGVQHAPASDTFHAEPNTDDPVFQMTLMKK